MTTEEKIWAYLDGQADEATRRWIEERRAADPVFRAEFAERELLHQRLAKMPLAGPSLRFAQGVMDKLPTLPSPFIPQRQLRAFGRAATVTIALYFLALALLGNRPVEGGGDGGLLTRLTDRFWASLPSADLDVAAALSLGFIALYFADRYLAKRARTSG